MSLFGVVRGRINRYFLSFFWENITKRDIFSMFMRENRVLVVAQPRVSHSV